MNRSTAKQLDDINVKFYSSFARAFSDTRENSWDGWKRLVHSVEMKRIQSLPNKVRVLDVGCGNGRFGSFLQREIDTENVDYLGIDTCDELLQIACNSGQKFSSFKLLNVDILDQNIDVDFKFSLIVVFGVMHHIPWRSNRKSVIEKLSKYLDNDGIIAVTFWKFLDHERYSKKMLSIDEYNRKSTSHIDPVHLEDGDVLLKWGQSGEGIRYCHHSSENEIDDSFLGLPLTLIDRFIADGKENDQNCYVVCKKTLRSHREDL